MICNEIILSLQTLSLECLTPYMSVCVKYSVPAYESELCSGKNLFKRSIQSLDVYPQRTVLNASIAKGRFR